MELSKTVRQSVRSRSFLSVIFPTALASLLSGTSALGQFIPHFFFVPLRFPLLFLPLSFFVSFPTPIYIYLSPNFSSCVSLLFYCNDLSIRGTNLRLSLSLALPLSQSLCLSLLFSFTFFPAICAGLGRIRESQILEHR